jgi:two-component system, NtrC family, nitrogen regulation response regulator NtrX
MNRNLRIPRNLRILIIEDDKSTSHFLSLFLEAEGYQPTAVDNGKAAKVLLQKQKFHAIIMDYNLRDTNGLVLTAYCKANHPDLPILMFSGYDDGMINFNDAKAQPDGFVLKGADFKIIMKSLNEILAKSKPDLDKVLLKDESLSKILGKSVAIQNMKKEILKYAKSNAPILILGPNGSGKELVAHAIVENSRRANAPFIIDNAAVCPETLVDSKYFGCVKGSHSEAKTDMPGLFDAANGGSIFLDEVGNMPPTTQEKLLRAIEYQTITPIGGFKDKKIDVRIIAATNKNLNEEIEQNRFMLDLFHRLSVLEIQVPSLNERLEDIPILAEHFIQLICKEEEVELKSLSHSALLMLQNHNWTGNIREFSNALRKAILNAGKNADVLSSNDFKLQSTSSTKAHYITL